MTKEKTILVMNLTRMGDLLQTTPLVQGLRKKYPDYRIILAVNIRFEAILEHFDDYDEKIALDLKQFDAKEGQYNIVDLYRYFESFIDTISQHSYDIVVNVSHSPFSGILVSMLETKKLYGMFIGDETNRIIRGNWVKYFNALLSHRFYNRINLVDMYCNAGEIRSQTQRLLYKSGESTFRERLKNEFGIEQDDLVIGFQAGSSRTGRRWKKEYFGILGNMLIEKLGAKICLLGVEAEMDILDDVNRIMEGRGIMLAGKTNLKDLGEFLGRADFLVTNDTGTMHIASGVGTKIISLFLGHAYPYETGPYCKGAAALMPRIECYPCAHSINCPDDVCTQEITPYQILEIIEKTGKSDEIAFHEIDLGRFQSSILTRSDFDENNYIDYLPLTKEVLTENIYFGIIYKLHMHLALGVERPSVYEISEEEIALLKAKISLFQRNDEIKEQFISRFHEYTVKLVTILDRGMSFSADIVELLQQKPVPIETVKKMSGSLVEVDAKIRELKGIYEVFSQIITLFDFDIEELEGHDALSLTKQTNGIYQKTKDRLLFLRTIVEALES